MRKNFDKFSSFFWNIMNFYPNYFKIWHIHKKHFYSIRKKVIKVSILYILKIKTPTFLFVEGILTMFSVFM